MLRTTVPRIQIGSLEMVDPIVISIVSPANRGGRRLAGVQPMLVAVSTSSRPEIRGQAYLVHNIVYERDGASEGGAPPASDASIAALKDVESNKECAMCLESVETCGKEMPCGHQFHRDCVEKWLRIHATCPLCRYQMPTEALVQDAVVTVGTDRAVVRGRRVVLSVLVIGPIHENRDESGQEMWNVLIDDLD